MLSRSSKLFWKKQLKVLLAFVVVASSFPAVLAPQTVSAAGVAPAPGGVSDGLISWIDMDRSVDESGKISHKPDKLTDQRGNRQWDGNTNGAAQYLTSAFNFNGGIDFPGSGLFQIGQFNKDDAMREIFSVQASNGEKTKESFPWEFGAGIEENNTFYGPTIRTIFGREKTLEINVDNDLKNASIMNIWSAPDDWSLSLNGAEERHEPTNIPNFASRTSGTKYYIGAGHNSIFHGKISEVILYNRKLKDYERQKVNSYLALKYGLTLKDENGDPTDYVDSAGNLMWSKENIGDYTYRITGIGKDAASGLEQRQSKSQESGALVTVALGNDLAPSNAEATPFPADVDNTYLTFSDNNQSTDYQLSDIGEPVTGHKLKKMDRVFKTQKSDNWPGGNVTLKLDAAPDTSAPVYNYYLLTSSDGVTFNNPPVELKLNDKYEVTLNSENLKYFTFAKVYKEDLKALVEGLKLYEKDHYTVDSWTAFDAAKTNAEAILAKGEASQEEVDNARDALQTGVEGLTLKTPDRAILDVAAKTVTIPFNYNVTLSALKDGFTVKIDGQEPAVDITNITFDPTSKSLTIALPANVSLNEDSKVTVDYKATNENVKGPYDKAVGDFTLVAEDPFAAALQIEQPESSVVNDKQPTISGTAEQGSTVTVVIKKPDGTEIAKREGIDAANGTWSFPTDVELVSGDYIIEATATNGNGKSATKTKELTVVDKSALEQKVEEIDGKAFIEADYTPETWTGLQEALTEARKVLENKAANQEEVNNALETLKNALKSLKLVLEITKPAGELVFDPDPVFSGKTAEGAEVQVTIKKEDGSIIGPKDAVVAADGTWTLDPADDLADGKYIIEVTATKGDITTTEKKEITVDTTNVVDKSALKQKAEEISGKIASRELTESNYTPASWNSLTNALEAAESVLSDPGATQDQVNQVLAALQEAEKNLVKVGGELDGLKLVGLIEDGQEKPVDLTPDVDLEKYKNYQGTVTNDVYAISLDPKAKYPDETQVLVYVNGKEYSSDEWSNLPLDEGNNTIIVSVQDNAGKEIEKYTITIVRERASGNDNSGGDNSGGGNTGGNNSGTDNTTTSPTPPTTDNPVKPGNIVTTDNGSNVSFASGTVNGDQATVTIDKDKLSSILADGKGHKLGINVPGKGDVEVRGLTLEGLKKIADTGSRLEIEDVLAIYPVPAGQLDVDAISKQFGNAPLSDIAANIKIKRSADDLAKLAREKATQGGYELLVHPVDLDLSFMHGGKTDKAGLLNGYAPKYIALPEGIDPNRITTGVIVNPDGSVFHVPTVVTKVNNRYFALINDLRSSGTYSVIWNPQDFEDVQYHWGRADVNNIAARLDLKGNGDNTFSPNRYVTRSEFAEIVVLGLGLMRQDAPQNIYPDVPSTAWYRNAVALADEFDIVRGYEDGNFKGGQQITREQGFAMIARAYRLIQSVNVPNQEQIASTLAPYADGDKVASWAKADVAQLIAAGIIQGNGPEHLSPKAGMTRAEVTALMARMLKVTNLIDK